MTVKTTKVLSCDAGCGNEYQIPASSPDEWSVAAAEAGWHLLKVTYRGTYGRRGTKEAYACPDCPPRTAADKVRADATAAAAEAHAESQALMQSLRGDTERTTP